MTTEKRTELPYNLTESVDSCASALRDIAANVMNFSPDAVADQIRNVAINLTDALALEPTEQSEESIADVRGRHGFPESSRESQERRLQEHGIDTASGAAGLSDVEQFLNEVSAERLRDSCASAFSKYDQGELSQIALVNTLLTALFEQVPERSLQAKDEPESEMFSAKRAIEGEKDLVARVRKFINDEMLWDTQQRLLAEDRVEDLDAQDVAICELLERLTAVADG